MERKVEERTKYFFSTWSDTGPPGTDSLERNKEQEDAKGIENISRVFCV